jgi:hypothetical protein
MVIEPENTIQNQYRETTQVCVHSQMIQIGRSKTERNSVLCLLSSTRANEITQTRYEKRLKRLGIEGQRPEIPTEDEPHSEWGYKRRKWNIFPGLLGGRAANEFRWITIQSESNHKNRHCISTKTSPLNEHSFSNRDKAPYPRGNSETGSKC